VIVVAQDQISSGHGDAVPRGHGVDLAALPPEVGRALAALGAAADALAAVAARAGVDLDGPSAAAVATVVAFERSRLAVTEALMLPVVEADGLWGLTAGSMKWWTAGALRQSARAAQAQVELGRELRDHLPLMAQAAAAGATTVEHAHVLARMATTTEARVAALADPDSETNEAFLVQQAAVLPVDQFRVMVRHWASATDPDADDRGYVAACEREFVVLDELPDGYHLQGFLSAEHGQALGTALAAVTPVRAADDHRSPGQRRAQALGDLAALVLDRGMTGAGRSSRPQINVHVSYRDLQDVVDRARVAEEGRTLPGLAVTRESVLDRPRFENGTPICRALLDKLACDGQFTRYIFGPQSEVLDVGRAERTFTQARRAAIIARDRHCQFPGCAAPPVACECHHVRHWSRDGGATSVDNGILLCAYHHDRVHQQGIAIHRRGNRWTFTDANGRELPDARDASPAA
jgi:hypothetical protein